MNDTADVRFVSLLESKSFASLLKLIRRQECRFVNNAGAFPIQRREAFRAAVIA